MDPHQSTGKRLLACLAFANAGNMNEFLTLLRDTPPPGPLVSRSASQQPGAGRKKRLPAAPIPLFDQTR